jgi:hypothetical protein
MGSSAQPEPMMAAATAQISGEAQTQRAPQAHQPTNTPPMKARPQTPPYQLASADATPPKGSKYAVLGTGAYIGTMILCAIPVIGWLACIIIAFASKNLNRRNFARAMLVFLIIGIVLSVALYFLFSWAWSAAQEYIGQYISEATNGAVTDFGGLNDLFDQFKGIGDQLPSMPTQ